MVFGSGHGVCENEGGVARTAVIWNIGSLVVVDRKRVSGRG